MNKKKAIIAMLLIVLIILTGVIITKFDDIYAFLTDFKQKPNVFTIGNVEVTVTEPHFDGEKIIKPQEEIDKDPTFQNSGSVKCYIRAQVYVPVMQSVKYVNEHENIVTPTEDIEILSYTLNEGWEKVNDAEFTGTYEDESGNKYNVYTYKYMQNGAEKIIEPQETITNPLFSTVKAINFLDSDRTVTTKLHVVAIAVQAENDQNESATAEDMWSTYKNQNESGIVGV